MEVAWKQTCGKACPNDGSFCGLPLPHDEHQSRECGCTWRGEVVIPGSRDSQPVELPNLDEDGTCPAQES